MSIIISTYTPHRVKVLKTLLSAFPKQEVTSPTRVFQKPHSCTPAEFHNCERIIIIFISPSRVYFSEYRSSIPDRAYYFSYGNSPSKLFLAELLSNRVSPWQNIHKQQRVNLQHNHFHSPFPAKVEEPQLSTTVRNAILSSSSQGFIFPDSDMSQIKFHVHTS